MLIAHYCAYGAPTKSILDEIIRKRGYLKKESKREPISNNTLIEELLGEQGVICIEDIIDAFWRCSKDEATYKAVKELIWPIQLAPLKETSEKANTTHDATQRVIKKKTTAVHKGGYIGMMGEKINQFVKQLI